MAGGVGRSLASSVQLAGGAQCTVRSLRASGSATDAERCSHPARDGGLAAQQCLDDNGRMLSFPREPLIAGHFGRIDDPAVQVGLVDAVQGLPYELTVVEVPYAVRLKQGVDALVVCAGQDRKSTRLNSS